MFRKKFVRHWKKSVTTLFFLTVMLTPLYQLSGPVITDGPARFIVKKGQSFAEVVLHLQKRGIVQHPLLLEGYARLTGRDTKLKSGQYRVVAGTTHFALLEMLSQGHVAQHEVTLIAGRTLAENLVFLKQSELSQTLSSADDPKLRDSISMQADTLEGLFFADTYFYILGSSDLSILKRAHQRLRDILAEEWQQRQPGLAYKSPYEALIVASIVERETSVAYERPAIAGVFLRRLRKGMRLQSDPTVIYGMGEHYDGRISRANLMEYSPYNTYRIRGLPPSPISFVGREAIHAALHPQEGEALYFVAKGDGTHLFSDTLAEHNMAVQRYQLNRRSDYRSTPAPASEAADSQIDVQDAPQRP